MIVLDTNVISELMRPNGDPRVVAWADGHPTDDLYLTAITVAELAYGVQRLPDGKRRSDLAERLRRILAEGFAGRILPFDDEAAACYPQVVVSRERRGLSTTMADAQIAAICRSRAAGLATRNTKDFTDAGIRVIDPWRGGH
jgi:predicted nucleic acid-binding protein